MSERKDIASPATQPPSEEPLCDRLAKGGYACSLPERHVGLCRDENGFVLAPSEKPKATDTPKCDCGSTVGRIHEKTCPAASSSPAEHRETASERAEPVKHERTSESCGVAHSSGIACVRCTCGAMVAYDNWGRHFDLRHTCAKTEFPEPSIECLACKVVIPQSETQNSDTPWKIGMMYGQLTVSDANGRVVARIGGQKLAWWERVVAAINHESAQAERLREARALLMVAYDVIPTIHQATLNLISDYVCPLAPLTPEDIKWARAFLAATTETK